MHSLFFLTIFVFFFSSVLSVVFRSCLFMTMSKDKGLLLQASSFMVQFYLLFWKVGFILITCSEIGMFGHASLPMLTSFGVKPRKIGRSNNSPHSLESGGPKSLRLAKYSWVLLLIQPPRFWRGGSHLFWMEKKGLEASWMERNGTYHKEGFLLCR